VTCKTTRSDDVKHLSHVEQEQKGAQNRPLRNAEQ